MEDAMRFVDDVQIPALKPSRSVIVAPSDEEALPAPEFSAELGTEDAKTDSSRDAEEILIMDARAQLSPAQMVEQKLLSLLEGRPLPFSQMLLSALPRQPGR
jgi:hypothetical protein